MLNNAQTYHDRWQNCLDRIKAQTSSEEFEKWFQPIVPIEFDGTKLRLRVPNESYVNQIEKNYISLLRPIIMQCYGQETKVLYAVPRAATATATAGESAGTPRFTAPTDTKIKNPFVIPGIPRRLNIDPQLSAGLTFDTFIEGECNRLARSAGMNFHLLCGTRKRNQG